MEKRSNILSMVGIEYVHTDGINQNSTDNQTAFESMMDTMLEAIDVDHSCINSAMTYGYEAEAIGVELVGDDELSGKTKHVGVTPDSSKYKATMKDRASRFLRWLKYILKSTVNFIKFFFKMVVKAYYDIGHSLVNTRAQSALNNVVESLNDDKLTDLSRAAVIDILSNTIAYKVDGTVASAFNSPLSKIMELIGAPLRKYLTEYESSRKNNMFFARNIGDNLLGNINEIGSAVKRSGITALALTSYLVTEVKHDTMFVTNMFGTEEKAEFKNLIDKLNKDQKEIVRECTVWLEDTGRGRLPESIKKTSGMDDPNIIEFIRTTFKLSDKYMMGSHIGVYAITQFMEHGARLIEDQFDKLAIQGELTIDQVEEGKFRVSVLTKFIDIINFVGSKSIDMINFGTMLYTPLLTHLETYVTLPENQRTVG